MHHPLFGCLGRREFLGYASGLFISALSPVRLLAETLGAINAIRHSSDKNRIRIVLDCSQEQTYKQVQDSTDGVLSILLPKCNYLSGPYRIDDPDLEDIDFSTAADGTLLKIRFRRAMKPEIFQLPADDANGKPSRIVIDLVRTSSAPSSQTSTQSYQRAGTQASPIESSNQSLDNLLTEDLDHLSKEAEKEELERIKAASSKEKNLRFGVKKIVIDAGHGGFDSGAVGKSGLKEKDVALNISNFLKDIFIGETDIKPYLSRRDDYFVPLGERTTIANQFRADLFVSIHINAAVDKRAEGIETFYCSETASDSEAARLADYENSVGKDEEIFNESKNFISVERILTEFERRIYWAESSRFAGVVQENMLRSLKRKNRKVRYANFYVLRRAKMPALLAEVGFISNPEEEQLLKTTTYQKDAARAIFTGIMSYVGHP